MVLTGSSEAGRSSHREPSGGRTRDGMLCARGGWGDACPQEQPFRSPFRLPHSDFHSSSALNYLYVCNYLFLLHECDGVKAQIWPEL